MVGRCVIRRRVMSLGTGAAYAVSKKQKLNTKSTTESELVGIDDVLLQALWTKYFMEGQGYGMSTIVNQDNQSTIRLANNGKASSGRGMRHINIRYFFITDRIARKEVAIQYCPTKQMVADYFTEPLQQSALFYKFRDQIMGVVPMSTILGDHRSVLDKKSNETRIMKHPRVSWKLDKTARKRGAHKMTGPEPDIRTNNGHPSHADAVKSRPPTDRKRQEKRVKR
jgi:hypothetical protein